MLSQISIPVANASQLIELGFTNIEIWKSEDLANTWQQITGRVPTPALILSSQARTTWAIGGTLLRVSVGGDFVDVSFSDTVKYWTPQMVAARINEVSPSLALADLPTSTVRLTTALTGRGQYLTIVKSPVGLFEEGFHSYGRDLDLELLADNFFYTYVDLAGAAISDIYRWRFSANGVSPISDYSERVRASKVSLDPSKVSVGYMSFAGVDGEPIRGRLIISMAGWPMAGGRAISSPASTVVESNENGLLQTTLLRGARVTLAIEGTTLVREVVVPNAPSFDIIALMQAAKDGLSVQTVPPLLSGRSL